MRGMMDASTTRKARTRRRNRIVGSTTALSSKPYGRWPTGWKKCLYLYKPQHRAKSVIIGNMAQPREVFAWGVFFQGCMVSSGVPDAGNEAAALSMYAVRSKYAVKYRMGLMACA